MSSEKTREVWRRACRKYRLAHPERVRQRRNQERIREANREAMRRWRLRNPEKNREAVRKYRAANLEQVRAASRAYHRRCYAENPEKHREEVRRWNAANPERHREAVRLWMQGHPERHEAHRQTWEKAHPESKRVYDGRRRARLVGNGGSHTEKQWIALCWSESWQCFYCSVVLDVKTVSQEHKVPLVRAGSDNIENIALSCRSCNSRKCSMTAVEFLAKNRIANAARTASN